MAQAGPTRNKQAIKKAQKRIDETYRALGMHAYNKVKVGEISGEGL